jgi:hypothetical protein
LEQIRNGYRILIKELEGRVHYSRKTTVQMRRKYLIYRIGKCGLDASGSRYGPVAGFCEHGDGL